MQTPLRFDRGRLGLLRVGESFLWRCESMLTGDAQNYLNLSFFIKNIPPESQKG